MFIPEIKIPSENDIFYEAPEAFSEDRHLCAFTGHRPSKLGENFRHETNTECLILKSSLHEAIKNAMSDGCFSFITGMATGVDTWAAEEVLFLKSRYPKLKLYAAVPYKKQYEKLYIWQKERYFRILSRCERVFLISEEYTRYCLHTRNSFMIENSDRLISVFDGTKGGTANTVKLAEKRGLYIYNILPNGERSPINNQTKLFNEEIL